MSIPSEDEILGYFEAHPFPLKAKALGRKLGLPKNDWGDLKKALFRLANDGKLERGKGDRFGPANDNENDHEQRQKPDHRAERAKSHRRFPENNPNPAEGAPPLQPHERLERDRPQRPRRGEPVNLVGIVALDKKDGMLKVQPCDKKRHNEFLGIIAFGDGGAKEGDVVVAENTDKQKKFVRITNVLGRKDAARMISTISLHEQGLRTEFTKAALAEANDPAKMAIPLAEGKRRDKRDVPFVTVDGADARDFDDAIFSEKTDKGWHIMVAIADVSWYVRPQDALNEEAFARGNSTYFPDMVDPMLPKEISNGVCSLNPGVDRAAMVFEMWLDNDGNVTKKADPYRALIKSAARLTYEQLQNAYDGQPDDVTTPLMDNVVKPLYGAYEALAKARAVRGTLDLNIPENKVKVSPDDGVESFGQYIHVTSHKVIEEFMIAANVAAAQSLEEKGSLCVYRVHTAPPNPDKLEALREYAASLGLEVGEDLESRDGLRDMLAKAADKPFYHLIAELMLRAQAKARYSTENEGHYGLALDSYAHFTSPIRRYADLLVHRLLVTAFNMGAGGITGPELEKLQGMTDHITETEIRSTDAERNAEKRYAARYLAKHVGETFSGQISSVNELGMFVKLDQTGSMGFIARKQLPKDSYDYSEEDHALIGRERGILYRAGANIEVKLRAADGVSGEVLLTPANDQGADIPGLINRHFPPANDTGRTDDGRSLGGPQPG